MFAFSRFVRPLVLLALVFGLAACGGGSGSSEQTPTFTVHGLVSNGPLVGGTVQVFGLNGGSVLASASTDADGHYAAEVPSAGPYRLRTTGGKVDGVAYTGVLEASCATGSDCNVTPYTTVLLRLVDEHGFNTGDAASHIAAISGLYGDPFVAVLPAEAFDLDAARQAISRGDGLSTWVASVVAWATGETTETPAGISKPGPAPGPAPDPAPDPDPETYVVNATAGTGGDISPASRVVAHGDRVVFTISSSVDYRVSSVSGCGGGLSGDLYTTAPITNACTINVQFALAPAFPVNNGKLTTRIGTDSGIVSLALQSDGKIVAAGTATDKERGLRSDVALARYNQDGTLDVSFGNGGIVTTNISRIISSTDWVTDMKIQGDGRIVVAGYTAEYMDPRYNLYLARYLPDGRLDTSFSDTGISITALGVDTRIRNIVLLDDGRILAAGGDPWGGYFLARYNSDGNIDHSFGSSGFVYYNLIEFAMRVAVNNDGKILVSGVSRFSGDNFASYLVLAQHHEDGSIDRNFGASGLVETVISWDVGSGSSTTDMLVQPDGKIVLGGNARVGYGHNELLVVRYNADGSLDSGFGNSGYVIKSFDTANDETSVALQADGSILATNRTNFPFDGVHPYPEVYSPAIIDFAIVRYAANGEIDELFGNNGMKTVDFRKMRDQPRTILEQPDGKVLVGGSSATHVPGGGDYYSFAIVRLNDDGSLDPSFNPR